MSKCTDKKIGEMLTAYALGALPEKEREAFEIHLLSCEYCYNEVKKFERQANIVKNNIEIKREAEVAAKEPGSKIWQRLLFYLWPKHPIIFRPAFLIVIIIVLVYPAYRGLFTRPGNNLIEPIQWINFSPLRSIQSSTFSKQEGNTGGITYTFLNAVAGESYLIRIIAQDETEIAHYSDIFITNDDVKVLLELQINQLAVGNYKLIISIPGDTTINPTEYYFRIQD